MHHPTDRIAHTMAFVTPVVEHWLEREIAQWVHPMKDRSDDPSHHERTLLPRSYISLSYGYKRVNQPGVCVPVEVHLEQPHDGLFGEEEGDAQRHQLPPLDHHVGLRVQLRVGQVHYGRGGGGGRPIAQEPRVFATQEQIL